MYAFDDEHSLQRTLLPATCIGVLAGVLVHLLFFIRGEWHVQAPHILVLHCAFYVLCPILAVACRGSALGGLLDGVVRASLGYLPGLMASIVFYRAFFHPLSAAGFPGPWYARITKLWHVWASRHARNHLVLADLHAEYGDFVRTGPAEVTVFHPDVFMAVDGPRSECVKGEWYDLLHPSLSLITARNKAVHAARRREWKRGFTTKAVTEHEAKILKYVDQLDRCIEADANAHSVSDMRSLFRWFGFDVMGEFTFSKPFGMLQSQEWHYIVVRFQRALSLLGPLSPAPWLIQIGFRLSPRVGVLKDWFDMLAWCRGQMRQRVNSGSSYQTPDLAYYLMEKDVQATCMDIDKWLWLEGDALLAIVAGSEPTAFALIAVFCELAKHPEHADKIYEELAHVDVTDLASLTRLAHLNAVMKEALRLYPGPLTHGYRKTTSKGITVGGRFIPPHTTIVTPRFSIGRRDDCFERPKAFVPERWSTCPEMVRNMAAYNPFAIGHHSCLGRSLALDMMRYVIARLVKKYRFRPGPGDHDLRVMEDLQDHFVPFPGALRLCFELRDGAE